MLSVIKTVQANLTIFTEGFASDLHPFPMHTPELYLLHLLPGSAHNNYLIPEKVQPWSLLFLLSDASILSNTGILSGVRINYEVPVSCQLSFPV